MCSRYHIDDGTAKEIEILIRQTEETLHQNTAAALRQICSTDIHPADKAPILAAENGGISCIWLRWGFPMQPGQGKGLVFNARCESAAEKIFSGKASGTGASSSRQRLSMNGTARKPNIFFKRKAERHSLWQDAVDIMAMMSALSS